MQVDGHASLKQRIAEADQFVHLDSAHLEGGQQGGCLRFIHLAAGHSLHQRAGFFTCQLFVVEYPFQYLFHIVYLRFMSEKIDSFY